MKIIKLLTTGRSFMRKYKSDYVTAFSAQAAFFIMLSFFPFIIFLLTVTNYLPFSQQDIIDIISSVIPKDFQAFVISIITDLYNKTSGTILSVSIIVTLWSASKGFLSLIRGLNSVYEIDESRNYVILRILATFYTFLFSLAIILTLVILVFGNSLLNYISKIAPFFNDIINFINSIRTLGIMVVLVLFFAMMYRFIPNRQTTLRKELPGALFATLGWSTISILFSFYIDNFQRLSYMYGSLTGVIMIMLWLYMCMNILLIGGEINYFLQHELHL